MCEVVMLTSTWPTWCRPKA